MFTDMTAANPFASPPTAQAAPAGDADEDDLRDVAGDAAPGPTDDGLGPESDLDEPDADDERDEPDPADGEPLVDEPADAGDATARAARRNNRTLVRRSATKLLELADAPAADRELLGSLFGVTDPTADIVELTVAVLTADRSSLEPVRALTELSEMDGLEVGITASAMPRPEVRRLWGILRSLDLASGALPAADAKAALALARAVVKVDKATIERLESVLVLAKRT